jgi:hypothetical protein
MCAKLVLWYECLCGDGVFPFYFATLETNTAGEEEEYFEGVEEGKVQGHIANQGKPSKLVAYLILVLLTACFINVYENACFYIAITSR